MALGQIMAFIKKKFSKINSYLLIQIAKITASKTQERISILPNICNPIIICNEEHRFIVAEQMREINITLSILLKPFGRNTALTTIAALKALESGYNPYLLVYLRS